MKKEKQVSGVIVPMISPVDEKGKVDKLGVRNIITSFNNAGVHPFILGTTGEATSISFEEKREFVKAAIKSIGENTKLYAGISSNCFEESVEMAKEFSDLGVYATVANLPSYYPLTNNQMLNYFEQLANAVNGPLVIYNIVATTHMSIPLDVIEKLSHHPRIIGLKDSEKDIPRHKTAAAMFRNREDFSHMLGWAAYSAQCMLNGSDGFVPSTGNFTPKMFKELYDAGFNNNAEVAFRLQEETNEIAKIYQKDRTLGQSLAALKIMMNEKGLCGKNVLPPLTKLNAEDEQKIRGNTKNILKNNNI